MKNARDILSENLLSLINSKNIDQRELAEAINVSRAAVSQWVNKMKYPRIDKIQLIADYFGVPKSRITEEQFPEYDDIFANSQYLFYPTCVSAGAPELVEAISKEDVAKITLPDMLLGKYAKRRDIWFTRINGDSMNRIIPDGSLIGVMPVKLNELKDEDVVVFSDQNEFSVKHYFNFGDNIVFRPNSDKNCFTDYVVSLENAENLKVYGKVVLYVVQSD